MQHSSYFIFMFAGQGCQFRGMGRDFYDNSLRAKSILDYANEYLLTIGLDESIKDIMFEGPIDVLTTTLYAQLAIFISEIVIFNEFANHQNLNDNFDPNICKYFSSQNNMIFCGHSLGEYSALCAAGAISFDDALKLIFKRGILMMQSKKGSMAAIIGADDKINDILNYATQTGDICIAANYNCNGQIVISGSDEAIEKAILFCKNSNIKCIQLQVSGAFHSPLMSDAENELANAISSVEFLNIKSKFYSCIQPNTSLNNGNAIKEIMKKQMTSPVRWVDLMNEITLRFCKGNTDSVENEMKNEMNNLVYEIAPKSVLANFCKKHNIVVKQICNINDII